MQANDTELAINFYKAGALPEALQSFVYELLKSNMKARAMG